MILRDHYFSSLLSVHRRRQRYVIDTVLASIAALTITWIIAYFHLYPKIPNISLLYLLAVLVLASTRGRYAPIVTSLVAFLSFDFFLIEPFYTFTIARVEEWLALFIFLATAIVTGQLAAAFRQRAEDALRREQETRILYELLSLTNNETDLAQQLSTIAQMVVAVFSSWGIRNCRLLLPDSSGQLTVQASALHMAGQEPLSSDEITTAELVMREGQAVELHEDLYEASHPGFAPRVLIRSTEVLHSIRRYRYLLPLKTANQVIGVMQLVVESNPRLFRKILQVEHGLHDTNMSEITFFWVFLQQAASSIERALLRQERMQIEVLRRTDALRTALLSSVSHDLRTPLASIKAAASSLLQRDVHWDEEAQRSFACAIEREADRLNHFVGNLLDMSRIEGGVLKPEKEWYPLQELVHDVLNHMQPVLRGREVTVDAPEGLPPVALDYLQIDQVLTNLIENAVRYTPQGSPILLQIEADSGEITVSVSDHGPGVPPSERERIFDKFYRVLDTSRNTTGSGLGLAVSRGLIEAHGGRIWEENNKEGGANFRFTLPLTAQEELIHV